MLQGKSVTDAIKARRSWRSYQEIPVPEDIRDRIRACLSGLPRPLFGSRARFALCEFDRKKGNRPKGTYGVIRGACLFLVGILEPGGMCFEDFGYLFEHVILYITSLGLGTCWMGGTFSSKVFSGLSGVQEKEIIPAVSPIGFIADKRTLIDASFALFAGSRHRKPWSELFFQDRFAQPLDRESAGLYSTVLDMMRIAPSASNKQPWRIVRKDGRYHLFLMRTPGYASITGSTDLQRIDMGIAMCHFELTSRASGLSGSWEKCDPGIPELPNRTTYVISWVP